MPARCEIRLILWSCRLRRALALPYWPICSVCLVLAWTSVGTLGSSSWLSLINSDFQPYSCHQILMVIEAFKLCARLYNPVACQHANTQRRIKQIIFWDFFSPYVAIKLILFNLLLVTLASVQISQHFCFGARVIQELRLDVTSYSHYESQRGSTLRSTQITTFFDALALPFLFLPLSLFCCPSLFAVPLAMNRRSI